MTQETQAVFARRLGVSKQCVADYIARQKIDGPALIPHGKKVLIDVEKATAQLRKRLDPDQRISGNARANLRRPAEPLPPATGEQLWAVMLELPATAAWCAAEPGGNLQGCYDAFADLRLNIGGLLGVYFGAAPPGDFEQVDWAGLAEEMGLTLIDPADMAADWDRRRSAPD
ncbi:hypothetical protein [Lichenibacterium ramalinae]|uniref:Uncharacterized protein n=1 Tax=Lichenibacterium ramalinae TaxID=2316527 RepID=A0A4Q2REY3_9HYPH|nr:hypothetical protein [Lichenibacterium ramalinae]RYB05721.1 hypothetical protein D3272_09055 [Lichenibacterium ramalinae]